jgi:Uma2 family endonuclease
MMITSLQTPLVLNTWLPASWEEFVQRADAPTSAKLKGYYYNSKMRFEPTPTGADHARVHTTIILALGLFASLRGIPVNGHDGCSYRKLGFDEFQPDVSYYVGSAAEVVPWGIRVIDLNQYPLPNLVIEISDTTITDDLGSKRLQYEDLGIAEYWIVNVQTLQILAFSITEDQGSHRIRISQVLPGLPLEILEQALERSRQTNQSAITAWLMAQFQP